MSALFTMGGIAAIWVFTEILDLRRKPRHSPTDVPVAFEGALPGELESLSVLGVPLTSPPVAEEEPVMAPLGSTLVTHSGPRIDPVGLARIGIGLANEPYIASAATPAMASPSHNTIASIDASEILHPRDFLAVMKRRKTPQHDMFDWEQHESYSTEDAIYASLWMDHWEPISAQRAVPNEDEIYHLDHFN